MAAGSFLEQECAAGTPYLLTDTLVKEEAEIWERGVHLIFTLPFWLF